MKEQAVYGHCKVWEGVSSKNNLRFQIVPTCEKSKRTGGDNMGIYKEGKIFMTLLWAIQDSTVNHSKIYHLSDEHTWKKLQEGSLAFSSPS